MREPEPNYQPRVNPSAEGNPLAKAWKRLSSLTRDELLCRGWQEINKRLDLARYRLGARFDSHELARSPESRGAYFFFSSTSVPKLVAEMRKRFPAETEQTISYAERICQHRFDLLGYEGIDYGQKIDWHLDAIHGKRAPRKPWYQIQYLDYGAVGDSKVTWELNRHQHLPTLAKAYRLTGTKQFAEELFRQWFDWMNDNPYPIGINWASSLEVAFRSLAWLQMRPLLEGCDVVPPKFSDSLHRALAVGARHIERYLSTYFSPNTHLLGEGVGLFFIGTLLPNLASSRRWQTVGWEIVLREAVRQVRPDGMHFEQSVYYHVYALDFFMHSRILASKNSLPIPPGLDQAIEKMLEFLAALAQAGNPPRIGDDDGGRVFAPRRNRAEHLVDPLATGAVMYQREDFKALAGGAAREETLWLLGVEGLQQFDSLSTGQRIPESAAFQHSGIYVMTDSTPVRAQLVVDAGPQGSLSAGHGHADALSLEFALNGHEVLSDPGTFCYVSDDNSRNIFRGTAAHNTLQVDGLHQSEPAGPFSWKEQVDTRVGAWVEGKSFELFRGAHTGYKRLSRPAVHCRWVFHLKSNFYVVLDQLASEGKHAIDVSWHLSPGWAVRGQGTGRFVLDKDEQSMLAVLVNEDSGWQPKLGEGWYSAVYGKKQRAPVLQFHRKSQGFCDFFSLLFALPHDAADLGRLSSSTQSECPGVSACTYETLAGTHEMVFAESGKTWRVGRIESDAKFLHCLFDGRARALCFVLCEGSFMTLDGQSVFAANQSVRIHEWNAQVSASGLTGEASDREKISVSTGKAPTPSRGKAE
jgi:hypothetical protein